MDLTKESDHAWKLEGDEWTCSRCGHSFKWRHDPPEKTNNDGSPAREDKAWLSFQILGMMSFGDVGSSISDCVRRKLVGRFDNASPNTGFHAIAFKSCFFKEELENLVKFEEMMET
jgi:hypothetical protein